MSRRESRESAFKLLYQMEFQKGGYNIQKEQFIRELNVKDNELEYFDRIVEGVRSNKEILDSVYSKLLKNWHLDRIPKVDQTILRISTYEILNVPDVPLNVSISEAVYLAKKYSTDEARAYINGILGKIPAYKLELDAQKQALALSEAGETSEATHIDPASIDAEITD